MKKLYSRLRKKIHDGPDLTQYGAQPNSTPYQYEPLDESRQEIRLLTILPGDDTISCHMVTVSLKDSSPFTACSYTWGDSSRAHDIYLNGKTYSVRHNLWCALIYIRKNIASDTLVHNLPCLFWIDAICINQDDLAERTSQVPMMSVLYASATYVLSWLGSKNTSMSSAFDFMKKVLKAAQDPNSTSTARVTQIQETSFSEAENIQAPELTDTRVDPRLTYLFSLSESVNEFFALDYWHRVWVVQELVLASPDRNVLMFEDEMLIFRDVQRFRDTWLAFLKTLQLDADWEARLSRTPGWESLSLSWTPYLKRMEESLVVWSYYDFMRGRSVSGNSLFYVLLATVYKAVDPRDVVYGVLSIVPSPRIFPDYMKSAVQVYTEWFTTVLEDWQNLQPLYFSGVSDHRDTNSLQGLPSWVPDLSSRIIDRPTWDATLSGTIEEHLQRDFSFGDQERTGFPRISSDGALLHARAIMCTITSETYPQDRTNAAYMAQICRMFSAEDKDERYLTGITNASAILKVLMCGINRFSSEESGNRTSIIRRDLQLSTGVNQIQLNTGMPFLQAMSKFLLLEERTPTDHVDDFVVQALSKISPPLGNGSLSDMQLAAAFILFITTQELLETSNDGYPKQPLIPYNPDPVQLMQAFFPHIQSDYMPTDLFQSKEVSALVNSISRYFETYEHTFFSTLDGYLGNGPPVIQPGDQIVVFDGAKMPFVVRAVDDGERFNLLGPCYVEGLSDGEPAAMARKGEAEVFDIQLI